MKTSLLLLSTLSLSVLSLLVPVLAQAEAPNLARNGDFELNPSNEALPQDWYFYGAPDASAIVSWDSAQKHGGKRSLAIKNERAEDYPNVFQEFRLSPGRYKITFWLKGDHLVGTDPKNQGAGLYLERFDAAKTWIGGDYVTPSAGTFGWKKVEATFDLPQPSAIQRLGLNLSKGTTGTAWFDDITLQKVADAPAPLPAP